MHPDPDHPFIKLRRKRIQSAANAIRDRIRGNKLLSISRKAMRAANKPKMTALDIFSWLVFSILPAAIIIAYIMGYL